MMLNWCYNEPWKVAANNSIIEFPAKPKPAYEFVKAAMRPKLFSARIPKFKWIAGDTFEAEVWLLNDTPEAISGTARASLKVGDNIFELPQWTAEATANSNTQGPTVRCVLPDLENVDRLTLTLTAEDGMSSTYTLQYRRKKRLPVKKILNM